MSQKHKFRVETKWHVNEGESTLSSRTFSRNHTVHIEGKPELLKVSSAKAFRGDSSCYNPEDMLLSALSSCHMMSYFYVCSQNGIEVLDYTDKAEGILEVEFSGKGKFTEINLNLVVTVSQESMIEAANELHEKAGELCFIANSCNFPIKYNATVVVK